MRFICCSMLQVWQRVISRWHCNPSHPRQSCCAQAESCFSLGRRPQGREGEEGKRAGISLLQPLRTGMHQPQKRMGWRQGLASFSLTLPVLGAAPPGRHFDGS